MANTSITPRTNIRTTPSGLTLIDNAGAGVTDITLTGEITHSLLREPSHLHQTFHYQQSADPGAVGAGLWWLDTTLVTTPDPTAADGLISWWELSEASGTRSDSQGTNHLTPTGSVAVFDGAASFDGTTYLSIADNASVSIGDVDCTFCGWFNLSNTDIDQNIIGQYDSSGQKAWVLFTIADQNVFPGLWLSVTNDGSTDVYTRVLTPLSVDTWYFFAWTHNAATNTVALSINATTPTTSSHSGGIFDGTAPLAFGTAFSSGVASFSMVGMLDQVAFWKRVLTATEIAWLYNSGGVRVYSDLSGGSFIRLKYRNDDNTDWITL